MHIDEVLAFVAGSLMTQGAIIRACPKYKPAVGSTKVRP